MSGTHIPLCVYHSRSRTLPDDSCFPYIPGEMPAEAISQFFSFCARVGTFAALFLRVTGEPVHDEGEQEPEDCERRVQGCQSYPRHLNTSRLPFPPIPLCLFYHLVLYCILLQFLRASLYITDERSLAVAVETCLLSLCGDSFLVYSKILRT